jgi:hypothetical protein
MCFLGGRSWRILHNEEFHNLYFSPDIIKTNNQEGCDRRDITRVEEMKNAYRILLGIPSNTQK